jgi:hypothetical protein
VKGVLAVGDRRRVLLVGIGTFAAPPPDRELRPGEEVFERLDFAHDRVHELESVFRKYQLGGYEIVKLLDPEEDTLREAIDDLLAAQEVSARIVHVISHGRRSRTQSRWLEVVTSGSIGGKNNAYWWVQRAQELAEPTLFLIDLCYAGQATNLDMEREIDPEERKAWVIGAARSYEKAFNGQFSLAAAEVLRRCSVDGLDTTSARRFVSIKALAQQIGELVKGQHVTSTSLPMHQDPELPFLPNPRWVDDPRAERIEALDPPLRTFLDDEVADYQHFRLRAGVHFTGRRAELAELVPWLDGADDGGLRVVTGTAGAGKSALLGVLVCAAHPELRDLVPEAVAALPVRPRENHLLAAVHARQRRLGEILESIAAQLHLTWPDDKREAVRLIEMIKAMPSPPVIVLDALDECPDYGAVQAVLLLQLATACRLLVGVRPWEQFEPLMALARRAGRLIDLDRTDPQVLKADLYSYLGALLADVPFASRLASGVADALARDFEQRQALPPEQRQGQFLVAGRFADYLARHPAGSESVAATLIAEVPTELSTVFELELSTSDDPDSLRAMLAALAFAKGDGMPQDIAQTLAAVFGGRSPEVLTGEAARLYLRIGTERDGTSLYRLYHQGLADYLRGDADRLVFDTIVATRRDGTGRRWWDSASPYLKRHAIHHAVDASTVDDLVTDPEFLVHADPATLILELDRAASDNARLAAAVYRTSYHLYRDDPTWRRRLLELNAARYQATELLNGLKGGHPW